MQTEDPHSPETAAAIQRSLDLSHWLMANTPREHTFEPLPVDAVKRAEALQSRQRHKVACALFEISIDHHTAVTFLSLNHLRSSAFALTRSIYDAAWRGAWIAYAAADDKLDQFCTGKYDPKPDKAIRQVEEKQGLAPFLSTIKVQAWDALCAFNHGGSLQIQRWIHEEEIAPRHSDAELEEVLRLADQLALVSGVFLTDMCNVDSRPIESMFHKYFQ